MEIKHGSKAELENNASELIYEEIIYLLSKKDFVVLGLVGGRSVSGIYSHLKDKNIDWNRIKIFLADERLYGFESEDSNYSVIKKELPEDSIVKFIYTGDVNKDLNNYKNLLKKYGGKFDVLVLGAGEDGHVAGLFPNHETIRNENDYFIKTMNSPKLPSERMSSSRKLISESGMAILVFFGDIKKNAFEKFVDEKNNIENCPSKIVQEIVKSYVMVDF